MQTNVVVVHNTPVVDVRPESVGVSVVSLGVSSVPVTFESISGEPNFCKHEEAAHWMRHLIA